MEHSIDLTTPFGTSYHSLGMLKESLDQFFREYQVDGQMIGAIRKKIANGQFNPYTYRSGVYSSDQVTTGCIKGWTAMLRFPFDDDAQHAFVMATHPHSFEEDLRTSGINKGDTPETNAVVAQLDSVLALCQAERSAL